MSTDIVFFVESTSTHRTMVNNGATTAPYCALLELWGIEPLVVGETDQQASDHVKRRVEVREKRVPYHIGNWQPLL